MSEPRRTIIVREVMTPIQFGIAILIDAIVFAVLWNQLIVPNYPVQPLAFWQAMAGALLLTPRTAVGSWYALFVYPIVRIALGAAVAYVCL